MDELQRLLDILAAEMEEAKKVLVEFTAATTEELKSLLENQS